MERSFLIITRGEPIPINAVYVSEELLKRGQNVAILRQVVYKVGRWERYRAQWKRCERLLKRRGVFTFLDNVLLLVPPCALLSSFISTENSHEDIQETVFPGSLRSKIDELKIRTLWYDIADANSTEAGRFVRKVAPDVIVLAGAPIMKEDIFKLAKDMAINMHLGITPMYQGCSPFVWAISRSDFNNIGFTIHHVAPTVDSGPIILQRKIDWKPWWSFRRLDYELIHAMSCGTLEVIDRYLSGENFSKGNLQNTGSAETLPPAGLLTLMRAYQAKKSHLKSTKTYKSGTN